MDILPDGERFRRFVPEQSIHYYPPCNDFGPVNFLTTKFEREQAVLQTASLRRIWRAYSSTLQILATMQSQMQSSYLAEQVGSYMILRLDMMARSSDA